MRSVLSLGICAARPSPHASSISTLIEQSTAKSRSVDLSRRRSLKQKSRCFRTGLDLYFSSWRGQDLNLRPSGYEPDELPDCSTPRCVFDVSRKHDDIQKSRSFRHRGAFEPIDSHESYARRSSSTGVRRIHWLTLVIENGRPVTVSECEYEGVNSSRRVRLDADADDQNLAIVPTHANPGAPDIAHDLWLTVEAGAGDRDLRDAARPNRRRDTHGMGALG